MNFNLVSKNGSRNEASPALAREPRAELPAIFGLRYLEEEAAVVLDVVGCMIRQPEPDIEHTPTATGCDDND